MTFKVTIKKWQAVANWTWNAGDENDVCGICRMAYESCPPDGEKRPPLLPHSSSAALYSPSPFQAHIYTYLYTYPFLYLLLEPLI
jgi:hypothetical protein